MTKIFTVLAIVCMSACYTPADGLGTTSQESRYSDDCDEGPDAGYPEQPVDAGVPDEDADGGSPVCGNQVCEVGETCSTCPSDCGECPVTPECGDGTCNGEESCEDCPSDCGDCPVQEPDAGTMEPPTDPVAPEDDAPNFGVEGGGCSTSGGAGGMAAALILFVGFLLRRKPTIAAFTMVTLFSAVAFSQPLDEPAAINGERFTMPVDKFGILNVDSGLTTEKGTLSVFTWLGYTNDSLVFVNKDTGERVGSLIGDRLGGTLGVAYSLYDNLTVAADMPFVLAQGRDLGGVQSTGELSARGLGNLGLTAKFGMVSRGDGYPLNVALVGRFNLPTNTGPDYLGTDTLTSDFSVSAGREFGRFYFAAQGGVLLEEYEHAVDDLFVSEEVYVKAGLAYTLTPKWELDLTVAQAAELSEDLFDTRNRNYSEAMAGVTNYISPSWTAFGLVGRGLNEGYGSPDFRGLIGLRYERAPKKPVVKKTPPAPVPQPTPQPDPVVPPVTPEPKVIVVDDTFFKFDSSELTVHGKGMLLELTVSILEANSDSLMVVVVGHTDSIGTRAYNKSLGMRRARAVAAQLDNNGVKDTQIVVGSEGEDSPRATNKTVEGRAANRRVEITIEGYEPVDHKGSGPNGSTDDSFGTLDKLK